MAGKKVMVWMSRSCVLLLMASTLSGCLLLPGFGGPRFGLAEAIIAVPASLVPPEGSVYLGLAPRASGSIDIIATTVFSPAVVDHLGTASAALDIVRSTLEVIDQVVLGDARTMSAARSQGTAQIETESQRWVLVRDGRDYQVTEWDLSAGEPALSATLELSTTLGNFSGTVTVASDAFDPDAPVYRASFSTSDESFSGAGSTRLEGINLDHNNPAEFNLPVRISLSAVERAEAIQFAVIVEHRDTRVTLPFMMEVMSRLKDPGAGQYIADERGIPSYHRVATISFHDATHSVVDYAIIPGFAEPSPTEMIDHGVGTVFRLAAYDYVRTSEAVRTELNEMAEAALTALSSNDEIAAAASVAFSGISPSTSSDLDAVATAQVLGSTAYFELIDDPAGSRLFGSEGVDRPGFADEVPDLPGLDTTYNQSTLPDLEIELTGL